jgi:hypothetical protein
VDSLPPDSDRPGHFQDLVESERQRPPAPEAPRDEVWARLQATIAHGVRGEDEERHLFAGRFTGRRLLGRAAGSLVGSLLVYAPAALAGLGFVGGVGAGVYVGWTVVERVRSPSPHHESRPKAHGKAQRKSAAEGDSLATSDATDSASLPESNQEPATPAVAPSFVPKEGTTAKLQAPRLVGPSVSFGGVARPLAPAPAPSARPVASGLDSESILLEQARSALRDGADRAALQALAEHERRFPAGKLAEEREVLQIESLARADRGAEARARAQLFRERFPDSLLLPAVQSALDTLR